MFANRIGSSNDKAICPTMSLQTAGSTGGLSCAQAWSKITLTGCIGPALTEMRFPAKPHAILTSGTKTGSWQHNTEFVSFRI